MIVLPTNAENTMNRTYEHQGSFKKNKKEAVEISVTYNKERGPRKLNKYRAQRKEAEGEMKNLRICVSGCKKKERQTETVRRQSLLLTTKT